MKYQVSIPLKDLYNFYELRNWLENEVGVEHWMYFDTGSTFVFEFEEDKVKFILKWL